MMKWFLKQLLFTLESDIKVSYRGLLLFSLLTFACGTEKDDRIKNKVEVNAVFFEKLDSLRVDYLG
ncbi:hypothetical protein, partial [Anditalea andensis]|uniref:hypothetical protein n=1 Tax=Anditalea andensis TaxID=1048983 RepID=UPI00196A0E26